MRIKVYTSKKDWIMGEGQLCESISEAGNSYCLTVEEDNEIKAFIGKNNRVYAQEKFSQEDLYKIMDCSRILVRYMDGIGKLAPRLYLARVHSNKYALMGNILTSECTVDAAVKMFAVVGEDVTVISFPVEVKKVYNCKAYSKMSGEVKYIELLLKEDFKEL